MGAFSDRFRGKEVMGVRNYIKAGQHVLLIRRMEMSASKNPTKRGVEKAVVDFKVIESDTMKKGEMTGLVEMESSQGYFGNVNAFVAGTLGLTIEEMYADQDFDAVFDSAWGAQQIFVGMLVRCTAQQVKTQAGGDYTAKSWEPVPASEYERYGLIAPDGSFAGPETAAPPQAA